MSLMVMGKKRKRRQVDQRTRLVYESLGVARRTVMKRGRLAEDDEEEFGERKQGRRGGGGSSEAILWWF